MPDERSLESEVGGVGENEDWRGRKGENAV